MSSILISTLLESMTGYIYYTCKRESNAKPIAYFKYNIALRMSVLFNLHMIRTWNFLFNHHVNGVCHDSTKINRLPHKNHRNYTTHMDFLCDSHRQICCNDGSAIDNASVSLTSCLHASNNIMWSSGHLFTKRTPSNQYMDSHYKPETVVRPS